MKVAIVNLGQIVSGDWHAPFVPGDGGLYRAHRAVTQLGGHRSPGPANGAQLKRALGPLAAVVQ